MGLNSHFKQRKIGPTHGSLASRIPLRLPSGPQETESELETELVEQLAFSMRVYDLITQPIITYHDGKKAREYASDVLVEVHPDLNDDVFLYLIEVKRRDDLDQHMEKYAAKFAGARAWCAERGARFRILDETHIRTPYLTNARLLSRYMDEEPDHQILREILNITDQSAISAGDLIGALAKMGLEEPAARNIVAACVAGRFVKCDLTKPFGDGTLLSRADFDPTTDPILKTLKVDSFRH